MSYGRRESSWLVIRRCLAIVRRAQRGLTTLDELIQAVLSQEGPEAYGGTEGEALHRRLEKDMWRIRNNLMIDLYFDRREDGYVIQDVGLPLLDLSDDDLATVAWLEQTFDQNSPQHDEVHTLLERLRLFLSPERRAEIERCRTALVVDLGRRDEDAISPAVQESLTKALIERRQVELLYRSPQQEDGEPRRHVVDPYERFFDTMRGHYYLKGWCHYTDGPQGRYDQHRYIYYRLGRIATLQVLPGKLPPFPPPAPHYVVAYELTPQVARLGVTHHRKIEVEEVERCKDGSAIVRGKTDDLFWAVRTLLHYGSNCRVLGGSELLREMQRIVKNMAEMYADDA